jgi:hypothetical protein
MKKRTLTILAIAACLAAAAFKIADDIITRLGMQQQNAQQHIINNLVGRFSTGPISSGEDGNPNSLYSQSQSFKMPWAKMLPDIISGDKAGAAKELCDYVKRYINSEEFITQYDKAREDAMPLEDKGATLATLKGNNIVFEKNINNYKTDTKYVAEQQKLKDENQKRIDAMLEAAKKSFPGKDIWEKTYPADPAPLIKKRLQEYLQIAPTVDFTAKLTGSGKRQIFVNPVYEKKSLKWKAIYRAGKEVNEVVTVFVKEWLKGEIISATKVKMTALTETPAPSGNNKTNGSNPAAATAPEATVSTAASPAANNTAAKPKKSLFNKIKDKTNTVIGN